MRTLNDPETVKKLAGYGYAAHSSSPEELGNHLRKEYQRMKALIGAIKLNASNVQ